jgi:alkylated DNA repair protein alkB family protein 8
VAVADSLLLPFRSETFDAAMSIAVLHHISSVPRRVRLIREVKSPLTS